MMRVIGLLLIAFIASCAPSSTKYHYFEGPIFGTSFLIKYEYSAQKSLNKGILLTMEEFNKSLSNYDPESVISRFNQNDTKVRADGYFTACFRRAMEISMETDGAFDMTVAPLVNAYGFGFTDRDSIYPGLIDSLLEFVGFNKVRLEKKRLIKDDQRITLDASAIAKGFGVDVVSNFLESKGVKNYLVEIGGELRCTGDSPRGTAWRVGVDKPIENLIEREIEAVVSLSNQSMATSGNYRQFYEQGNVKYSHTIDPSDGSPVRHSLLSATVLAPDCMTADAYATAFMVMGLDEARLLVNKHHELEAYLIYSGDQGELLSWSSSGMKSKLSGN
ncbi:MAG: FAD:protein FMN transferase [Bacteroidetes bacterium]|nr:FAD:protein FMN transferase [Bacteroidota bacterium]